MMRKLAVSAAVIVGVGVGAYLLSGLSEEKNKGPESSQETPANSSPAPSLPSEAVVQAEAPASTTLLEGKKTEHRPQDKTFADFKYRADLEKYLGIRKKVLLAKDEEREKKNLLQDRALIQSMKSLLLVEASQENADLQNAALDFLFEALQSGASDEVTAVLQAVVADGTIENTTSSLESRKALAGVKAEVLLNWSSIDPKANAQIEASLPGPVSQKIWSRVKAHQDNNVAESETLQNKKTN